MWKSLTVFLACFVIAPPSLASQREHARRTTSVDASVIGNSLWRGPISRAGAREAARIALERDRVRAPESKQTAEKSRSWVSRHPVVFGALLGGGVGAVTGLALEDPSSDLRGLTTLVGFGGGAGLGALIGGIIGAVRD